jgi:hypothetical protein
MVRVRRLIETPTCRRYVQIDIRDFLLSERELARKYGVPWYGFTNGPTVLFTLLGTVMVLAGLSVLRG